MYSFKINGDNWRFAFNYCWLFHTCHFLVVCCISCKLRRLRLCRSQRQFHLNYATRSVLYEVMRWWQRDMIFCKFFFCCKQPVITYKCAVFLYSSLSSLPLWSLTYDGAHEKFNQNFARESEITHTRGTITIRFDGSRELDFGWWVI